MPKTKAKEKMVVISVHLPKQLLEELDEFVRQGRFPSRSEVIRVAVRELVYREKVLRQRELELEQMIIPGR